MCRPMLSLATSLNTSPVPLCLHCPASPQAGDPAPLQHWGIQHLWRGRQLLGPTHKLSPSPCSCRIVPLSWEGHTIRVRPLALPAFCSARGSEVPTFPCRRKLHLLVLCACTMGPAPWLGSQCNHNTSNNVVTMNNSLGL